MVGVLYRAIAGGTLDWLVAGTVNPTNNTVSISGADNFGDLYAMDNTTERLPIVLISFDAKPKTKWVELNWVTAIEENNQLFTIERSKNGIDFSPVVYVEGAGTTNAIRSYKATDVSPILGRSYYRLKQTDFNGQFDYSEIVSVVYEGETQFDFGLMLNPATAGEDVVLWKTDAVLGNEPDVYIRDIKGQVVFRNRLKNNEDEVFLQGTSTLSAGVYFITVNYFGENRTKKLIIR